MPYSMLTAIGDSYVTERGNPSVDRIPALTNISNLLQGHIALANLLKAQFLHADRPANMAAMPPRVPGGQARVKALVNFYEGKKDRRAYLDRVNAEVAILRKWLSRQGVHQTTEGTIIWNRSMRKVEYDTTLASQGLTRVSFRNGDGLLYLGENRLDTRQMVTNFKGPGFAIYVMSAEGHIHVSSHAVGYRHHSSLVAGQSVAGAGELQVIDGRLVFLSNKSGHYHADICQLFQTLNELEKNHIPLTFLVYLAPDGPQYPNVAEFMGANYASNEDYKALRLYCAIPADKRVQFLDAHNLVFQTKGQPDIETTGFYRIEDGPPEWQFPNEILQLLEEDHIPTTGSIVRPGTNR